MYEKILALAVALFMIFSIVGCNSDDTNSKPKSKPESVGTAKEIETAEDLVGVWKVIQPLPEYFTEEYCEELGLEDFKTSAVYEWQIELHNDGTQTYVLDYELNKESRKKVIIQFFLKYLARLKKYCPKMSS